MAHSSFERAASASNEALPESQVPQPPACASPTCRCQHNNELSPITATDASSVQSPATICPSSNNQAASTETVELAIPPSSSNDNDRIGTNLTDSSSLTVWPTATYRTTSPPAPALNATKQTFPTRRPSKYSRREDLGIVHEWDFAPVVPAAARTPPRRESLDAREVQSPPEAQAIREALVGRATPVARETSARSSTPVGREAPAKYESPAAPETAALTARGRCFSGEQERLEVILDTKDGDFEPGDPDNPKNWPRKRKLAAGSYALLAGFIVTFGTPIYISAVSPIMTQFDIPLQLAIVPASMYPYGIGVGALLFSAISEFLGRPFIYRITMPLCLLFTCVGGAAESIATLNAARFLAGMFSAPALTVGAALLSDVWDTSLEEIGTKFAVLFVLSLILATQAGPMASAGILKSTGNWRWTFWVNSFLLAIVTIGAFWLPETYGPEIIRQRARKAGKLKKKRNLTNAWWKSISRPIHMLLVEPVLFPAALLLGITQAVVFSYYIAYAILFETTYRRSPYSVGMFFAPMMFGSLFAVVVIKILDTRLYQPARQEAIRSGGAVAPEKRLYPAMLGSMTLPISILWLAWSGFYNINYWVPLLSGWLFGFSYVLNMMCLPLYTNDIYTVRYSASVLAGSTFIRFVVSASFPLFTVHMVNKLGIHWALTVLAAIAALMIFVPFMFFYLGPRMRSGESQYLPKLPPNVQFAIPPSTWATTMARPLSITSASDLPRGSIMVANNRLNVLVELDAPEIEEIIERRREDFVKRLEEGRGEGGIVTFNRTPDLAALPGGFIGEPSIASRATSPNVVPRIAFNRETPAANRMASPTKRCGHVARQPSLVMPGTSGYGRRISISEW
ncbi:major facilitator superfamily domain-containing protein [Calycina marina]|uniref:Major facilitator superfamily domain-containing protein n=1 Tax=Calycina marina TaxID=1763456 RepID=A0A9P7Z033_9HELO|nr:major facilitator superfamily domain-containing protein [Calycina marina]